ncbi:ubiquitin-conjugating enzyme E2 32-like [Senna tora]|uniref:Ubiquitin-conjugating enzyme E2 32-like n=1 Tax=Senna tora TaxID=362788 RepID=A0A834TZC5_9FABA|nr:ubiquitin-conjugating enzyme E2 32-like [Senna tora]
MPTSPNGVLGSVDYKKEERLALDIKCYEAPPRFVIPEPQKYIVEVAAVAVLGVQPEPSYRWMSCTPSSLWYRPSWEGCSEFQNQFALRICNDFEDIYSSDMILLQMCHQVVLQRELLILMKFLYSQAILGHLGNTLLKDGPVYLIAHATHRLGKVFIRWMRLSGSQKMLINGQIRYFYVGDATGRKVDGTVAVEPVTPAVVDSESHGLDTSIF